MTSTAIAAARLLREYAEELKRSHTIFSSGAWPEGESEAKAAYEQHIAIASALEAMPAKCLHQIQEPTPVLVAQPQLHAALFAARGALQHMKEGGKPTQSLLNEAIAAIDSVAVTQAAPAAVAVPDAVRDAEKLLRAEAARLARIYGSNKWYGFSAEKESYLEHLRAAAALAATPQNHIADAGQMVENVREGAPYENPAFEKLARELGVWGTAQSAVCAQFWLAATPAAVDYPTEADPATETVVTLEAMEAWHSKPTLAAAPAADAPAQTIERQRMTAGRASFFMERFLREEKLLGPNEQAALQFVIDMLEAEHATLPAELATQAAQPVLPTGWVPCVVTYEGQHPEEVAYGPQIMMDRLKKWLERYFEMKAAAPVVLPEPVSDEQIKAVFLANGFTIKEGLTDLKPYVYQAARALLATGGQAQADMPDSFREWFAQNYPADTIIVDPDWHAKSIFRMAQAHARLAAPQAQAVGRGEVLVTVSGFTGSGKSAIAGEIEILCRALGLQVEWPDGESEKNMTHADWTAALEQYKPRVRIVEQNIPFVSKKGLSK